MSKAKKAHGKDAPQAKSFDHIRRMASDGEAVVMTATIRCSGPYWGVNSRLFKPNRPNPAATAACRKLKALIKLGRGYDIFHVNVAPYAVGM